MLDYIEIEDEIMNVPGQSQEGKVLNTYGGQISINDEFVSLEEDEARHNFEDLLEKCKLENQEIIIENENFNVNPQQDSVDDLF